MEQLDNNKIPRIRSAGEKYRELQLILQVCMDVIKVVELILKTVVGPTSQH